MAMGFGSRNKERVSKGVFDETEYREEEP